MQNVTRLARNPDKYISKQGLIKFYQNMLDNGTLVIGGAGHARLLQLQGVTINGNNLKTAVDRYLAVKK
tara:strand:- start:228 stop:434 length:207 start_codon:yes stop_codon:yes gene_type:complete